MAAIHFSRIFWITNLEMQQTNWSECATCYLLTRSEHRVAFSDQFSWFVVQVYPRSKLCCEFMSNDKVYEVNVLDFICLLCAQKSELVMSSYEYNKNWNKLNLVHESL